MKRIRKFWLAITAGMLLGIEAVSAHCPLCTMGAAAAAAGAAYFGVSSTVIGLFIGAFAVSMGWWIANLIKKQVVPFQKPLIIIFSFITTVLPLMPLISGVFPLYISLAGSYGSLLNRTYVINLFFVGSLIGGLIVSAAPWLSKRITLLRNGKMMPYQGILLTFCLLVISGVVMQVILR